MRRRRILGAVALAALAAAGGSDAEAEGPPPVPAHGPTLAEGVPAAVHGAATGRILSRSFQPGGGANAGGLADADQTRLVTLARADPIPARVAPSPSDVAPVEAAMAEGREPEGQVLGADGVLAEPAPDVILVDLADAGVDLPCPTTQALFHDQTEAADGDRARQREGLPAGEGRP